MMGGKLIALALLTTFPQCQARAQSLVPPEQTHAVAEQFGNHSRKNTLECQQVSLSRVSYLGFDLRYHAGFYLMLPLSPGGGRLEARIRVIPRTGAPVLLAEYFDIPPVSQALSNLPQPAAGPIMASIGGTFLTGPGKYKAELLLISPDNKTFFKRWTFRTEPSSGFVGPMKPNAVGEVLPRRWDGKLNPRGIRLTLLLNATSRSASQAELWDYQFLLTMVRTVLEQLPCRSLRVVAFNLDQEAELFRRDGFSVEEWDDLEAALKGVQLSTIDYRKLRPSSRAEFLTHLVEDETSASADAVLLLGRLPHFLSKSPKEIKPSSFAGAAKLYYLRCDGHEYNRMNVDPLTAELFDLTNRFPEMPVSKELAFEMSLSKVKPIPDSLTYLLQDLHGTVLPFVSSREFGKSIERLRDELASLPSAASDTGRSQTPPSASTRRPF